MNPISDDANPKDAIGRTKAPLRLIPPVALVHQALAHRNGSEKYGAYNWRDKKVQASVYYEACLRHLLAWYDGEEVASDSGVHHLGHAIASLNILLDAQSIDCLIDDRPPHGGQAVALMAHIIPPTGRGSLTSADGREKVAAPIADVDRVEAENDRLRKAMERLFPVSEGFGEEFDTLKELGLIVMVPADEVYREEWGDDTMYVWAWHPLALNERQADNV